MIGGAACGQHAVCPTVDVLHAHGLGMEVPTDSLDDADGINPDISAPKCTGNFDSISESSGQLGEDHTNLTLL